MILPEVESKVAAVKANAVIEVRSIEQPLRAEVTSFKAFLHEHRTTIAAAFVWGAIVAITFLVLARHHV
jgi:hypothetical protein